MGDNLVAVVTLYDAASGARLGSVSETQLQQLADALEEETSDDRDYYVNRATVEMLRDRKADAELVATLEAALAGREEIDIRWERA